MNKPFDARRLDVRQFAEAGATLQGSNLVREFPRLLVETEGRGADRPVSWAAEGELTHPGRVHPGIWLRLRSSAAVPLVCQRCLSDVEVPLEIDREYRFERDEKTAAAEDDEAEEDVLALSRSFDLLELLEDELLMHLPVAPRHTVCPVVPSFSSSDGDFKAALDRRENPFAVLQAIKPKR